MKPYKICYLAVSMLLVACSSRLESQQLDKIEDVMEVNIDSGYNLLDKMLMPTSSRENTARYNLLLNWAKYARYDKEFDIESIENAYSYYKDSKDNVRKAQAHYIRTAIYDQLNIGDEEQKAIGYFTAAKAVEKTDNHRLAAQIYQRIAAAMNYRHLFQEALEWGQKYREEARKSGDKKEEVIALLNLAMAYCWHSDSICETTGDFANGYKESVALTQEALTIATNDNNVDGMMRANDKLSSFHSRAQNVDSALHYALIADSLKSVVEARSPLYDKRGHTSLGDAYRKMGKKLMAEYERTHDKAILAQVNEMAQKAMEIVENDYKTNPIAQVRQNAAQLGYLISKDLLKDQEMTFYYLSCFNHIQDSLQREQQNLKVLTTPIRIEKEEVEATLDKTRRQLWWLVAVFFIALLAGSAATVFISRRNRRILSNLKDELNDALASAEKKAEESKTAADATLAETDATTDQAPLPVMNDQNQPIVIESSTNESLTVRPADLLYITVESNNLYIAYMNNGKVTNKSLRSTMKVVDSQLLPFTNIVRCHRAFMVNLSHVKYAVTTSAGLSLLLDTNELIVPVSRSFVDSIKKGLKIYGGNDSV